MKPITAFQILSIVKMDSLIEKSRDWFDKYENNFTKIHIFNAKRGRRRGKRVEIAIFALTGYCCGQVVVERRERWRGRSEDDGKSD
jgi:hypothetical protein